VSNRWRYPAALAVAIGIAFPALAVAANDSGGTAPAPTKAKQPPKLPSRGPSILTGPRRQWGKTVRVQVHAIRGERQRQHASRFSHLPGGVSRSTLNAIAQCESGGNPRAISAGGTYRGKYQFDYGTWASVGGHGDPAKASEAEQDYRAALLYERSGSSPWPVCG
jgi:soluble lytic murein transglycosylase-like protein